MVKLIRETGFTLVELIIVIILLGIVSVYASSRYIGISSFSSFAAQEQVISIIRQIQVNRMQSNLDPLETNLNFQLTISNSCLGSTSACDEAESNDEIRSDIIRSDNLTFSTEPSVTSIDFDLLGNPLGNASGGVDITLTSEGQQASICINSQGYVGGC
ncbi:prepilin-type N-terminal cleavage/methylation domain-containing protein [Vibrio sp. T187]|nr:prepilin-type N-terminal cleavage/methylation domain-containing protein [Vibrio sp. T187]